MRAWTSIILAEKAIAIVILHRDLGNKLSNVKNFIILRPERGRNENNRVNFYGEKKYNEAFRGVYFLRMRKKTLSQISSSYLKISIGRN